jgi:hypothetical protein
MIAPAAAAAAAAAAAPVAFQSLTKQYVAAHPGDAAGWLRQVILRHLQESVTAVQLVANDLAAARKKCDTDV